MSSYLIVLVVSIGLILWLLRRIVRGIFGRNVVIKLDVADLNVVGADLFIRPRRTLTAVAVTIITLFSLGLPLAFISSLLGPASERVVSIPDGIYVTLICLPLLGIAYFLMRQSLRQPFVHFNTATREIRIGKDLPIAYDAISGIYLQNVFNWASVQRGIMIIQTGIVKSDNTLIPLANVSYAARNNLDKAMEVVRVYANHLSKIIIEQDYKDDTGNDDAAKSFMLSGGILIFPLKNPPYKQYLETAS
jgi:hypothetical protein